MKPRLCQFLLLLSALIALSGCSNEEEELAKQRDARYESHIDQAKFYSRQGQLKASILEAQNAHEIKPEQIEPVFLVAQNLITAGDAKAAENKFRDILRYIEEEKPITAISEIDILLYLAESLVMQRRLNQASELLATIEPSDNEHKAKKSMLAGEIAIVKNELSVAKEHFQNAAITAPTDVAPIIWQARIAYLYQDDTTVDELVKKAESIEEGNSELWLLKAQLAQARGALEESEDAYIRALEQIGQFDVMTAKKYKTISQLVSVLRDQGKIKEAFVYEEILAKSAPGTIRAIYEEAVAKVSEGNLDGAAADFESILAQSPNHSQSAVQLAIIRYNQGRYEEADQLLSGVLDPDSPEDFDRLLAATKLKLNQPQAAYEILQKLDSEKSRQDPAILELLGVAQIANGDIEEGLEKLKSAQTQAPDNPELATTIAKTLITQGQLGQARQQLKPFVLTNGKSRQLSILTYLREGDFDTATRQAQSWIDSQPQSSYAHSTLGMINVQAGKQTVGINNLARAVELSLDSDEHKLNLIKALMSTERYDEAFNRSSEFLTANPRSEALMNAMIEIAVVTNHETDAVNYLKTISAKNPNETLPILGLARVQYLSGNFAEASKELMNAKEKFAYDQRVDNAITALYRAEGRKLYDQGKFKEASKLATEAIAQTGLNLELGSLLYSAEAQLGNSNRAGNVLRELKANYADSPLPYELESNTNIRSGKIAEAVSSLRIAYEKSPSDLLLSRLHNALLQSGQNNEARLLVTDAVKQQPKNPARRLLLGLDYQASGEMKKAIDQYRFVVDRQPRNTLALNNLAWLLFEEGDEEAVKYAQRAFEYAPNAPAVLDTYGWILFKNGQLEEAIPVLERAYELAPDTEEIKEHLIEAYNESGLIQKANNLRNG